MPEMRMEQSPSIANVSLGDVSVSTEAATAGVQKEWRGERTDDLNLPAGAYYVNIRHVDFGGGDITINGRAIQVNEEFSREERTDEVNNTQDFVGAITIVAGGRKYELSIAYPSNNAFDPTTLD